MVTTTTGLAVLLTFASTFAAQGPPERVVLGDMGRLPAFSHATVLGDTVFVSGTLGTKPGTVELVAGGVQAQTRQTLRNVGRILEAAGSSLGQVAKCNVYLADMADFPVMNETYLEFFGGASGQQPPARTTVGVAQLALGAAVEIECIARSRTEDPMRGSMALPGGVQPLPTQETGFVESGGERIYYESTGSGETLVLTHGYGGNHAIWFQQVVAFAPRYRVVTWDARGFGRSTRSSGDVSVGAAALDLETLLDHLGVERAHLVGQSMGGWTVLRFALDHPQRVHSLVLADTPGGIATAELAEAWLRLGRDSAAAPSPAELPIDRHPAIDADLGSRDPALAFLYRQIASVAAPAPEEIPRLLAATSVADEELQRLGVPVLFVVGSTDPIFPPELIHATAARVPNARVVELPGGGHSPYFEQAAAWNRVLAEFLRDR